MDERLLAVVGRDAGNINLDPRQRKALIQRHQLTERGEMAGSAIKLE